MHESDGPDQPIHEQNFSTDEWHAIRNAIARLRASVMAMTFGIVGGLMLFVATAWLVILGPTGNTQAVGPSLGLLRNYFPGYSVTWGGAVIGLFYGALVGATLGFVMALVYNRIAVARHAKSGRLC